MSKPRSLWIVRGVKLAGISVKTLMILLLQNLTASAQLAFLWVFVLLFVVSVVCLGKVVFLLLYVDVQLSAPFCILKLLYMHVLIG